MAQRPVNITIGPEDRAEPQCDFCRSTAVRWRYPAASFDFPDELMGPMNWGSIKDWAACDPCAQLIEVGDTDGLLRRFLDQLSPELRRELSANGVRQVGSAAAILHGLFLEHRTGDRVPWEGHGLPSDTEREIPRSREPLLARPGLEIPPILAHLPRDRRGLPIPFTALADDGTGTPDFRVLDVERVRQCVENNLCGVCGRQNGHWLAFIGGPACRDNRLFRDPPMHVPCAEFSAKACPFISREGFKYARKLPNAPEGMAMTLDPHMAAHQARPPEMFLFVTRRYRLVERGIGPNKAEYFEAAPFVRCDRTGALS